MRAKRIFFLKSLLKLYDQPLISWQRLIVWWVIVAAGASPPPLSTDSPCPTECLCLSQSQVICNSPLLTSVPAGLSASVSHLSLSRADIQVLRSDAFINLRFITYISLDYINLSIVKPFAFRGLPKIREIIIQHTPLSAVNSFAFAGLQNVTTIVLSNNRITQVEGYAFAGTNFLMSLSLKHNPLKKLSRHAFSGLTGVGTIELPSGIKAIEPGAFQGLEGVSSLELSFMDLDELQRDTFNGMIRIGKLSLKDSDLGVIRSGAFDNLAKVDILEIVNNKIDAAEEFLFEYNSSIKTFKFSGNHMLESPLVVLLEVENFIIIDNHLPCECESEPYINPLAVTDDFDLTNYCISPLWLRGKTLMDGANTCREGYGLVAKARANSGSLEARTGKQVVTNLLALFLRNLLSS